MGAGNAPKPTAGMTIHQAKGQEWERVAVVVKKAGHEALLAGLDVNKASDRTLYVGMTRARRNLFLVRLPAADGRPSTKGRRSSTSNASIGAPEGAWFAMHAAPLGPEPSPVSEQTLFRF